MNLGDIFLGTFGLIFEAMVILAKSFYIGDLLVVTIGFLDWVVIILAFMLIILGAVDNGGCSK
jgi:hypothetical protein|tara:strand:+ start:1635 stop:1823 length:189 start_codon:yes stop_codon:yes gene_type:complete